MGERVKMAAITDPFVTLNRAEAATPKKNAVAAYRELELQDRLSRLLRGVFASHRAIVSK